MISKYEIRENSLTKNSVFLLLVKADEQGRDAIQKELPSFCNLIEAKVKGFDYVFELSGITDDSMLEKIRTKLDYISSAVFGLTQTFGNSSSTKIMDIEQTFGEESLKLKMTQSDLMEERSKQLKEKQEIMNNDNQKQGGLPVIDMSHDGEPSQENKEETPLKEQITGVEEENKTIVSFSPDEMKNISMEIETEKKGLFKSFFGKIKKAVRSNKNNQGGKAVNLQEQGSLASMLNESKYKEKEGTSLPQSKISPADKDNNPFQNLGEGLIVKKGMLSETEPSSDAIKKELNSNPVTAKLQVDDIFAAETICNFYANQPESQKQEEQGKEESPLDILEKSSYGEDKKEVNSIIPEEKTLSKLLSPKKESVKKDSPLEKTEKEETFSQPVLTKKETADKSKEETQKNKIFEGEELKKLKESTQAVNVKKEENIINKIKNEKENIPSDKNLKNKGEKNMQKQQKETQADTMLHQNSPKPLLSNSIGKRVPPKIDHTLHIATPAKDVKYRNYPIEMPLIPTYTFANMDISSIRFAHAMAMVTLDDLGKSNNPFLIQGISGTGKTHFLHAMGYEISKKIPQSKILFTNGVRLSRGVQYLLEKGQQNKLDEFFNNTEVLIVDDIHLTAVNEHNREYISQILNNFLKDKKQIILSSKYPPESLKRFEELVNFKFSMGAVAELKVPNKAHFERLTNKIISSSFLDLTEKQVQSFFIDQNDSLGDVARNVKRVKVLSRRIESSGIKKLSYEEILKRMTAVNGENEESEIAKKDFDEINVLERTKESSWGNFGFFFPASNIDKFRWVAFASQEAAKELGIKGGFNYALKSAYSTEHIISAAFKIANICDLKGLKGAVILGPSFMECSEPIRDNFYDILTHMLEVMMIRCGTINFEDIKKPSAYVKMLGDILK